MHSVFLISFKFQYEESQSLAWRREHYHLSHSCRRPRPPHYYRDHSPLHPHYRDHSPVHYHYRDHTPGHHHYRDHSPRPHYHVYYYNNHKFMPYWKHLPWKVRPSVMCRDDEFRVKWSIVLHWKVHISCRWRMSRESRRYQLIVPCDPPNIWRVPFNRICEEKINHFIFLQFLIALKNMTKG